MHAYGSVCVWEKERERERECMHTEVCVYERGGGGGEGEKRESGRDGGQMHAYERESACVRKCRSVLEYCSVVHAAGVQGLQ